MVKLSQLVLPFLVVGSANAFAPGRAFVRPASSVALSEETEPAPAPGGAIIPIKEETVEFTAGILGAAVGFAVGGPVLGAVTAAAANYAAKNNNEVGEVLSNVSKSAIEVFNYLSKLDSKYEVLDNAKGKLEEALDNLKKNQGVNSETVEKVENALAATTSKITEVNDEYDLVGAGVTALGVVGELVEKAVVKAGELNEEYKLSDKALDSIKGAASKATDAAKKQL